MEEKLVGHTANMVEVTNSSHILARISERKRPQGRSRRRWKDNIRTYLKIEREGGYGLCSSG
jgi:hypothetical protein